MYVLELDYKERQYLLSMLKRSQSRVAAKLAAELASADDVFGVVCWSNSDLERLLVEHGTDVTVSNVNAVRGSYYARHVGDRMIESGWEALGQAILEL